MLASWRAASSPRQHLPAMQVFVATIRETMSTAYLRPAPRSVHPPLLLLKTSRQYLRAWLSWYAAPCVVQVPVSVAGPQAIACCYTPKR